MSGRKKSQAWLEPYDVRSETYVAHMAPPNDGVHVTWFDASDGHPGGFFVVLPDHSLKGPYKAMFLAKRAAERLIGVR